MREILIIIILFTMYTGLYGQNIKEKTFHTLIESVYKKEVPIIFADTLKDNLDEFVLLDSRTEEEFNVSHLENARLVCFEDFCFEKIKDINKSDNIVVYCSIGFRSQEIAQKLQAAGYENVHNLYGGIFEWKNLNYEVVNNLENPTDSVHTYNKIWGLWLENGIKVN